MSNNALEAIRKLVGGSVASIKIMQVVAVVFPDSVAVEADGERRVVKGNYPLGIELTVNGNTVLGISETEIKRKFVE